MTFEEIRQLIIGQNTATECIKECREALASNDVVEVQPRPGQMIVRDALGTFRIRANTSKAAGIETCGFDETLNALAALPADENVLMFHFSSQRCTFSVFVSESRRSIIGCIRVNRRDVQAGS